MRRVWWLRGCTRGLCQCSERRWQFPASARQDNSGGGHTKPDRKKPGGFLWARPGRGADSGGPTLAGGPRCYCGGTAESGGNRKAGAAGPSSRGKLCRPATDGRALLRRHRSAMSPACTGTVRISNKRVCPPAWIRFSCIPPPHLAPRTPFSLGGGNWWLLTGSCLRSRAQELFKDRR